MARGHATTMVRSSWHPRRLKSAAMAKAQGREAPRWRRRPGPGQSRRHRGGAVRKAFGHPVVRRTRAAAPVEGCHGDACTSAPRWGAPRCRWDEQRRRAPRRSPIGAVRRRRPQTPTPSGPTSATASSPRTNAGCPPRRPWPPGRHRPHGPSAPLSTSSIAGGGQAVSCAALCNMALASMTAPRHMSWRRRHWS